MQINISVEELRKRKIFLAVPMYGGNCTGVFAKSFGDLMAVCTSYGIVIQPYFIFNESLIQRARNYCTDVFLRSDCTHLMFIDSDIGFNAQDVLALLALSSDESEYDVITAPYPKKVISWEKVKLAVDKGFADENPNTLNEFVGDYVFNPVMVNGKVTQEIRLDTPAEVSEAGTGFMMIRRATLEKYKEAYPELAYRPDHVRTKDFSGDREIHAFFDCIIEPDHKRYLSEDYFFCYNVRKAGMKVWMCPWIKLHHVGSYVFSGSLEAIAMIGANPTADENVKKYA